MQNWVFMMCLILTLKQIDITSAKTWPDLNPAVPNGPPPAF
jgi:hypothetical protein